MATKTAGTAATTTLTAIQIPPTYNATPQPSAADIAAIMALILDDSMPAQALPAVKRIINQALVGPNRGRLYIPNRGFLQLFPGDWVGVDAVGFPYLIGSGSLPQTLTATGNTSNLNANLAALSTNVLNLGWRAGMTVSGTGI